MFPDFSDANRPSKDARRVFLFMEDGEVPQFAWVRESPVAKEDKTTTNGEDFNMADEIPPLPLRDHLGNLDDFLSEDGTMKAERVNFVLQRQIGHGILVMGRHRMDLSKDLSVVTESTRACSRSTKNRRRSGPATWSRTASPQKPSVYRMWIGGLPPCRRHPPAHLRPQAEGTPGKVCWPDSHRRIRPLRRRREARLPHLRDRPHARSTV